MFGMKIQNFWDVQLFTYSQLFVYFSQISLLEASNTKTAQSKINWTAICVALLLLSWSSSAFFSPIQGFLLYDPRRNLTSPATGLCARSPCSPFAPLAINWTTMCVTLRLFSVQNHSLSNLIHHEWMNHQLNNWFLLIPKPKFGCDTCHCYHQVDHLVGWIKRNQKDSIRIIFLSDFWVPIALIHVFDSGIKRNQIFEWAVFTQLKTA